MNLPTGYTVEAEERFFPLFRTELARFSRKQGAFNTDCSDSVLQGHSDWREGAANGILAVLRRW